jgi:hypothetical protein
MQKKTLGLELVYMLVERGKITIGKKSNGTKSSLILKK